MKSSHFAAAAFTAAVMLLTTHAVSAQVAGSTTVVGVSVVEETQVALGWSAKKSILGKTVFNDAGAKIGKVEDLIIAPERKLSYLIVGVGGFVGFGRHDVAIPMAQIQDTGGRLVISGATKDVLKGLPVFNYSTESEQRSQFAAKAQEDIAKAKTKVGDLEKRLGKATVEARVGLDGQIATLKDDLKTAEDKVGEMNHAAANRWREFEADVSAALTRLRKSIDTAAG